MSSKAEEAQKHIQEAEKNLKSGFFKKPEYDLASYEYAKAAVCFKNARQYDKAIDAYVKANDCCMKTNNHFQAAKHLSEASLICKEAGQFDRSADLAERAGEYYMESRSNDSAAIALERSAKAIESNVPERAVRLYEAAARAHEVDEKLRDVSDALGNAARLLVKIRQFGPALEVLKRRASVALRAQDAIGYARNTMYSVLILLVRASGGESAEGDPLSDARRLFDEANSRCEPLRQIEDGAATDRLIKAFETGDSTLLAETIRLPAFRNAENEFAKLTRLLKVDEMQAAMRRLDIEADAAAAAATSAPVSKWDTPASDDSNSHSRPPASAAPASNATETSQDGPAKFTDADFEDGLA